MSIDQYYSNLDKNNFYLGMVTQVYKDRCVIQTENLTWLQQRRLRQEYLIPSTINNHVVIDSHQGIFIGEVIQAKIRSSQNTHQAINTDSLEDVVPELHVEIIGILCPEEKIFLMPGFETVGLMDYVYLSNNVINEDLLHSLVGMRRESNKLEPFASATNFGNKKISIDTGTLFSRHLLAIGTTNSGKSTTSLTILDKLIKEDKKILIIDPTGEYSQSFNEEEIKKLTLGVDTVLDTGTVTLNQWATVFETNDSTQPAVLANAIESLKYQAVNNKNEVYVKEGRSIATVRSELKATNLDGVSFNLSLLPQQVVQEAVEFGAQRNEGKYVASTFQANNKEWLVQKINVKLEGTQLLDFFSSSNNSKKNLLEVLREFMNGDIKRLYIDASKIGVGAGIGAMIVDLISMNIMNYKTRENPAFAVFIDEVHRYTSDNRLAENQIGLTSIAREGRKKGVFLFLTTQSPNDVPVELLSQMGSLLIHRLTHRYELESVRNYLNDESFKQIPKLNQGEAIFTSINILKELHLKIVKSDRVHYNDTPIF